MAAVYPYQYKSWTAHKNLIDDVDASHVNNLQDEVAALQSTMGLTPHQDTTLTMRTNKWSSVGARMDAIQRGQGIPVCYLYKSNDSFRSNGNPGLISFGAPVADPENIYNGHGITVNRSGWWTVNTSLIWTSGPASGDRQLGITVNGQQVVVDDKPTESPDGWTNHATSWQGPVTKGQNIDMQVYHPLTGQTVSLQRLCLAVSFVREL